MTSPNDTRAGSRLGRLSADLHVFPRQFWLLTLGFLVLLFGVDMCFPLETLYMTGVLGVSATTIGVVLGLPIILSLPLHIVGGAFTDRYGRRPAMIIGISVVTALYATFAFAGSLWPIAVAIAIEAGIGWALFLTGSNAMIADLVPQERRTEAYGLTRVALNVGMVMGPLLARLLLDLDPSYRAVFITGGAICATFVGMVAIWFRETRPAEVAARHESLGTTMRGYSVVLHDRRFVAFCLVALLPLYGFGQIWSIFPVALKREFAIPAGSWTALLMTYAAVGAITQYPIVRSLRDRDHLRAMSASSLLLGVGFGTAVLLPYGASTYLSMAVLSLGVVVLIPVSATIAAELAPVALRGRYMGAWTLVQMGGYALGPLFGGLALDVLGPRGAFTLVATLALLGAVLFVLLSGTLRRRDEAREEEGRARDREIEELVEDTVPGVPAP
jgi:MFS family permease